VVLLNSLSHIRYKKWSKNFDERPHRRGRNFHGEKLVWHRPVGSSAMWAAAVALMPSFTFCCMYSAVTYNSFQWAGQSPESAPSRVGSGLHLTMVSWVHPNHPQTASHSVQPFKQNTLVWPPQRQTHKQTDHATCDIRRSRPHLCYECDAAEY